MENVSGYSRLNTLYSIRLSRTRLTICKDGAESPFEAQVDDRMHDFLINLLVQILLAKRIIDFVLLRLHAWLLRHIDLRLKKIKMRVHSMHDLKMFVINLMFEKGARTDTDADVAAFEDSLVEINFYLYWFRFMSKIDKFVLKILSLIQKRFQFLVNYGVYHFLIKVFEIGFHYDRKEICKNNYFIF